jgi:RNA polymerase sigma factor (sigma-70 family)
VSPGNRPADRREDRGVAAVTDVSESNALGVRLAAGDDAALEECYARFGRPVLSFLRRYVGADEAEDVLQRTFLDVWRNASRYDPARPLSTWVFTIAHHRAVDSLRRHRPAVVPIETLRDLVGEDGRQIAERHAWAAEVREALDRLPDIQREALELAYFQGQTQVEIAATLGIPLGTVKARMARGMRRMAELVVREGVQR